MSDNEEETAGQECGLASSLRSNFAAPLEQPQSKTAIPISIPMIKKKAFIQNI
jgi:hypothetical protein